MEDFTNNPVQNTVQPSGPQPRPAGQNLGIAALITAIVTFVLAVIPCVGLIAIIPAIIAIVLSAVGLSQASRSDAPKGVIVAALVIGIVAFMISVSQIFVAGKIGDKFDKEWGGKIENVVNDVQENVLEGLEDANVNIKVESGDEKIEISTGVNKKDRVKELEDLEKADTLKNDSLSTKK